MAAIYEDLLTPAEITEILEYPAARCAKAEIDAKIEGIVSFTLPISAAIRLRLATAWGIELPPTLPLRWIKGDTRPHLDRSSSSQLFTRTHLAYLTDSPGALRIANAEYPIAQGTGYVFAEGLPHETTGTADAPPRLLLGPMSETGLAVGGATTISANGATDTVYFKYISGSGLFYRINDGSDIGPSLPITIVNTNTSGGMLQVLFETDITIESDITYFICGSSHIQFGSTSLNPDGSRPVITIDGVTDYPGLIRNGFEFVGGQSNIYICNLEAHTANGSTVSTAGGWIAQQYFGKAATDNYIVNCASTGEITEQGGGIVGAFAASQGGTINVIGCSSSGSMQQLSGGIVGKNAGETSGAVYCIQCWSTGIIQGFAGGIYGDYAGSEGSSTEATNCYSTGSIGNSAGGIFGSYAGNNGNALAVGCYSTGSISTDGGGIFGIGAGSDSGNTEATNCYSSGAITTAGTGIYGTGKDNGTATSCYVANGAWSTAAASSALTGTPAPTIGSIWVATGINQPFELKLMGYRPHSVINITTSPTPTLIRTSSATVAAGTATAAAIVSGKSYTILETSDGDTTITIDFTSGAISTTAATVPGVYQIWLRNTGSYNITEFELTVTATVLDSCCSRRLVLSGLDYVTRAQVLAGNALVFGRVPKPMSYADYVRRKKALAFRRAV